MKSWQLPAFGFDSLQLTDAPDLSAGPGQVVVRAHGWSLNYRDLMVAKGEYNPKMQLPATPLSDCAGEVVECGSGVTRWKAGDRVVGAFMPKWISGEITEAAMKSALGAGGPAGVASAYVVFDEAALAAVPERFSYAEAATLPCAGVTAWHALGGSRPNEWVLVQGTGGVALFALQIAKMKGARVLLISSSDEKIARAVELGADATINYSKIEAWDKAAREITGGNGVDHLVEIGGSGTMARSMRAVRAGGTIYTIGMVAGRGEINFIPLFMRTIRLQGIFVGSCEMLSQLADAYGRSETKPIIDQSFAFEELPAALRAMEAGGHFGKICLTA